MNAAEAIIQKFGGQSKLAALIERNQSTVQYWASSETIPAKWQPKLLKLAQETGVPLSPEEFLKSSGSEFSPRHRTIADAVKLVMQEKGRPLKVHEIFNEIVGKRLYLFNTDNPIGVLTTQIRRHCLGLDFVSSSPIKFFAVNDNGKYSLLEKSLRTPSTKPGAKPHPKSLSSRLHLLYADYVAEVREDILARVRRLDPTTFEVFAKKLLQVYGFEEVHVTPPSRDGGIDGYGKLKVGLAHLNVAFQCKNWRSNQVGRPEIDKFRGASQGQFEQAILFTTSRFTSEATGASFRPGAIPVILIDGPAIVDIMIEKRFGIEVKTLDIYTYAIDLAIETDEESSAEKTG